MEHTEPTSAQLGIALKQVLEEIGMTQEALATFAGIPRNSLNRKINGGVFTFEELTRIAHALKRPLSNIIALAEEQTMKSPALAGKGAE